MYLVEHKLLKRKMALKLLLPELATRDEMVERFLREAQSAFSLHHQNIIRIYDVGREEGLCYFSMDYIRGRSLKDQIREKAPLSENEIISISRQILSALAEAHAHKIVHRDIKPDNILINSEDRAIVTDFGIAKTIEATKLTVTGSFMGTVRYTSPEQIRAKGVDLRSDLYSFGIVMYEMATGSTPFTGPDTTTILYQHAHEKPEPPRKRIPSISTNLNNLILKALNKKPENRFPSAQAMMEALDSIEEDKTLPPSIVSRGKKKRTFAWTASIVIFAAGSIWGVRHLKPGSPDPAIRSVPRQVAIPEENASARPHPEKNAASAVSKSKQDEHHAEAPDKTPDREIPASSVRSMDEWLSEYEKLGESIKRDREFYTPQSMHIKTLKTKRIETRKRLVQKAKEKIQALNREVLSCDRKIRKLEGELLPAHPEMVQLKEKKKRLLSEKKTLYLRLLQSVDPVSFAEIHPLPSWAKTIISKRQLESALKLDVSPAVEIPLSDAVRIKMIFIPPGRFIMHDPLEEDPREAPMHQVQLSGFYMGIHEVTQGQWKALTGDLPFQEGWREELFDNPAYPMVHVTRDEILQYIEKVNALPVSREKGYRFALPTEAQWEYACRAGTPTHFYFGDEFETGLCNVANQARHAAPGTEERYKKYALNVEAIRKMGLENDRYHVVGSFPPNPFGLYDMAGNVKEWCLDLYDRKTYWDTPARDPLAPEDDFSPVSRGGSYSSPPSAARSGKRSHEPAGNRKLDQGFRLVMTRENIPLSFPDKTPPEPAPEPLKPYDPLLLDDPPHKDRTPFLRLSPGQSSRFGTFWEAIDKVEKGTTIYLKPGIYTRPKKNLYLKKDLRIIGEGDPEKVIIESVDDDCLYVDIDKGALYLRNLTVRTRRNSEESSADDAVYVDQGNLTVENCIIESENGPGINLSQDGSQENAKAIIRHCVIRNCVSSGITILHSSGVKTVIEDCTFENNRRHIDLGGGKEHEIRRCRMTGAREDGVLFNRSGLMEFCVIGGSGENGIHTFRQCSPVIRECRISGSKKYGIQVSRNSGKIQIEECHIHDNQKGNVRIGPDDARAVIKNCAIYNSAEEGVVVYDEDCFAEILGCRFFNHGKEAIRFRKGSGGVIRNSRIYNNKRHGVWIATETDVVFESNTLHSNNLGPFLIFRGGRLSMKNNEY